MGGCHPNVTKLRRRRSLGGKVKLRACCFSLILFATLASVLSARPSHLRCEYLENPLGIDRVSPQLSWQSDNAERNWEQAGYQIVVASSLDQLRTGKAD